MAWIPAEGSPPLESSSPWDVRRLLNFPRSCWKNGLGGLGFDITSVKPEFFASASINNALQEYRKLWRGNGGSRKVRFPKQDAVNIDLGSVLLNFLGRMGYAASRNIG